MGPIAVGYPLSFSLWAPWASPLTQQATRPLLYRFNAQGPPSCRLHHAHLFGLDELVRQRGAPGTADLLRDKVGGGGRAKELTIGLPCPVGSPKGLAVEVVFLEQRYCCPLSSV